MYIQPPRLIMTFVSGREYFFENSLSAVVTEMKHEKNSGTISGKIVQKLRNQIFWTKNNLTIFSFFYSIFDVTFWPLLFHCILKNICFYFSYKTV